MHTRFRTYESFKNMAVKSAMQLAADENKKLAEKVKQYKKENRATLSTATRSSINN